MAKGWTEKQDSMGPQTPGRVKRLFGAQKKSGEEGSIPGRQSCSFRTALYWPLSICLPPAPQALVPLL